MTARQACGRRAYLERGGRSYPGHADRRLSADAAHRQHRAAGAGLRRRPDRRHPGCFAGRACLHRPRPAAAGGKHGHACHCTGA
ncbi:MAG: hypothetical protein ACLVJH_14955 [Faecalibacterium prausnitzii]